MQSRSILVGVIAGAHGIRGEVKLKSFTANPADIARYGPLATADGRCFEILRMKPVKDEFVAALKGIDDRNRAEALKGTELYIDRSRLPSTANDETYLADLVGKTVVKNGAALGVIVGFQNFGAGELIELQSGLLVPCRFVERVENGKIIVSLPDGFLDAE